MRRPAWFDTLVGARRRSPLTPAVRTALSLLDSTGAYRLTSEKLDNAFGNCVVEAQGPGLRLQFVRDRHQVFLSLRGLEGTTWCDAYAVAMVLQLPPPYREPPVALDAPFSVFAPWLLAHSATILAAFSPSRLRKTEDAVAAWGLSQWERS